MQNYRAEILQMQDDNLSYIASLAIQPDCMAWPLLELVTAHGEGSMHGLTKLVMLAIPSSNRALSSYRILLYGLMH